jgi:hypothetical protein
LEVAQINVDQPIHAVTLDATAPELTTRAQKVLVKQTAENSLTHQFTFTLGIALGYFRIVASWRVVDGTKSFLVRGE